MTSVASCIAVAVSAAGSRPDRLQAGHLSPEVGVELALERRPGGHSEALADLQCHLLALDVKVEHDLILPGMAPEKRRNLLDHVQAALRDVDVGRLLALHGSTFGVVPGPGRLGDHG